MAFIDTAAALKLKELREDQGLSPEGLAAAIAELAERENWTKGTVDAYTIRRIERTSVVPTPRVAFVLAHYFGLVPHQIWRPARRVKV